MMRRIRLRAKAEEKRLKAEKGREAMKLEVEREVKALEIEKSRMYEKDVFKLEKT